MSYFHSIAVLEHIYLLVGGRAGVFMNGKAEQTHLVRGFGLQIRKFLWTKKYVFLVIEQHF